MRCSKCGAGPHCGFPVYRNNPTDEDPPDWRCKCHLDIPIQKVQEGAASFIMNFSFKSTRKDPNDFTFKQIQELQKILKSEPMIAKRKKILIKFRDQNCLTNKEALTLATCSLPKL